MANSTKLGIFKYLRDYFDTVQIECGAGDTVNNNDNYPDVETNCPKSADGRIKNILNNYYQNKYYPDNRGNQGDVAHQFTTAVIACALNLRKYDVSTTTNTAKQVLNEMVNEYVNAIVPAYNEWDDLYQVSRPDDNHTSGFTITTNNANNDNTDLITGVTFRITDRNGANNLTYNGNLDVVVGPNAAPARPIFDRVVHALQNVTFELLVGQNINPQIVLDNDITVNTWVSQLVNSNNAVNPVSNNLRMLLLKKANELMNQAFTTLRATPITVGTPAEPAERTRDISNVLNNRLSESDKQLFHAYANIVRTANDEVLPPSEYAMNSGSPNNFRINLKNDEFTFKNDIIQPAITGLTNTPVGAHTKAPRMYHMLPVLPMGIRVHITGSAPVVIGDADFLRELFVAVYKYDDALLDQLSYTVPNLTDGSVPDELPLDVDRMVKDFLKNLSFGQVVASQAEETPESKEYQMLKNGWVKVDASGKKFQKINPDGTVVEFTDGDDKYNEYVSLNNKCASTQTFEGNQKGCQEYLRAVISGDPAQLMTMLTDNKLNNLWGNANENTIRDVHPMLALQTLSTFGFMVKRRFDAKANATVNKVQDVESWIKMLEKKNDNSTTNALNMLNGNSAEVAKVKRYLNLLSELVNANPTILNENFVGATTESAGLPPACSASMQNLEQYNPKRSNRSVTFKDWSYFTQNMNNVNGNPKGLSFANGVDNASPFGLTLFPQMQQFMMGNVLRGSTGGAMRGGDLSADEYNRLMSGWPREKRELFELMSRGLVTNTTSTGVQQVMTDMVQTMPNTATTIVRTVTELMKNISSSNKNFTDGDKERIHKKMQEFGDLEKQLYNTAETIMKYSQLIRMKNDSTRQTVTEEGIKSYVKQYESLLKQFDKSQNVFQNLIQLLQDNKNLMEKADTKGTGASGEWAPIPLVSN